MSTNLLIVVLGLLVVPAVADSPGQAQWIAFNRAGAGNSSFQCFTPNNVEVSGGSLVITTKAETSRCSSIDLAPMTHGYTSGFVAMRSFNFLYGTLTFRAKLGGGTGTGAWPIVWMADASCQKSDPSGTDDDCNGQELDVTEIYGDFTHINQQIHVDDFKHNDGCSAHVTDVSQNFHLYQLDWSPGSLSFKVDGVVTCTIEKRYVPDSPMYVKINTFVGGFGGAVRQSSLPWQTQVDYVRVTQGGKLIFSDEFNDSKTIEPGEFVTIGPSTARKSRWSLIESSLLGSPRRIVATALGIVAITIGPLLYRWKTRRELTN
jgi:beta-glucanase (GH16 family)